jgi:hypothetical protein
MEKLLNKKQKSGRALSALSNDSEICAGLSRLAIPVLRLRSGPTREAAWSGGTAQNHRSGALPPSE